MLGRLIKWALIVIIGVLVYNYFYGTEEEKQQSEAIFNQTRAVGQSIVGFVTDETQKVKDGKYNDVIDNISEFLGQLKSEENAKEVENIESDLREAKEKYDSKEQSADSLESQLNTILKRVESLKSDS
jgi:hypothetical protein